MNTTFSRQLFESVLVERIIIEENSGSVILKCNIFDGISTYKSELFIDQKGLNSLLCELSVRGIELDLEKDLVPVQVSEDEVIYIIECSQRFGEEVFIPMYALPQQLLKMRA